MTRALWLALAACAHSAPPPGNEGPPPAAQAPAPKPRKVVTDTQIEILDPIRFVGQTAQIELASLRTLDAVAETLDGNPSILVIEVHAYGAAGAPEFQQRMGDARANAIVAELVKRKIAPDRLRPVGEATAATPGGAQVVFIIAKRR